MSVFNQYLDNHNINFPFTLSASNIVLSVSKCSVEHLVPPLSLHKFFYNHEAHCSQTLCPPFLFFMQQIWDEIPHLAPKSGLIPGPG